MGLEKQDVIVDFNWHLLCHVSFRLEDVGHCEQVSNRDKVWTFSSHYSELLSQ